MTTTDTSFVCARHIASQRPAILRRRPGESVFTEVHRGVQNPGSPSPDGRGYYKFHGLDSFIVCCGGAGFHGILSTPAIYDGAFSYSEDAGNTWTDVVLDNHRFSMPFVAEEGVVYLVGTKYQTGTLGTWEEAGVYKWTKATGLVLVQSFSQNICGGIHGTGPNFIIATGDGVGGGGNDTKWFQYTPGTGWVDKGAVPGSFISGCDALWIESTTEGYTFDTGGGRRFLIFNGTTWNSGGGAPGLGSFNTHVVKLGDGGLITCSYNTTGNEDIVKNDLVGGGWIVKETANQSCPPAGQLAFSNDGTGADGIAAGYTSYNETTDYGETWSGPTGLPAGYDAAFGAWLGPTAGVPYITLVSPLANETGVPVVSNIEFTITSELSLTWTVEIDRGNGFELALTYSGSASFSSAFDGDASDVVISDTVYSVTIDPISSFGFEEVIRVQIDGSDAAAQGVSLLYSFITAPQNAIPHLFEISRADIIGVPNGQIYKNEFDNHASLQSVRRKKREKNWQLRRRVQAAGDLISSSSDKGILNGVLRGLSLEPYFPLIINPKTASPRFLAPDPLIKIDNAYVYLYSDYKNGIMDHKIDRYEKGGNYETLGGLVEGINQTPYFEAALKNNSYSHVRSMVLSNQINRKYIEAERVPVSTRFQLKKYPVVTGSLFFDNKSVFQEEVVSITQVDREGRYYIDYWNGIITCYSLADDTLVRYWYINYPFLPIASDVILYNINEDSFRAKMFDQILLNDGTYTHGVPNVIGVDLISELLTVHSMYYGE